MLARTRKLGRCSTLALSAALLGACWDGGESTPSSTTAELEELAAQVPGVRVMTQNLYVGLDVFPILAAPADQIPFEVADLTALPAPVQPQALAQIVYTAAELEGVTGVQITIEGEAQPLPKGNGDATTGLLRPYDYPGYIQTSQPAYPALPAR